MTEQDLEMIRPELRNAARLLAGILPGNTTPAGMIRMNERFGKLLNGKWVGRKTEAHAFMLDRENGTQLRVLVVTKCDHKQDLNSRCTGVLWCHGGGYGMGLPEQDLQIASLLTENDDALLVLPDYRRSVEAPYPAALDDCWLALKWMISQADILGIDAEQIFVGGEGAGGGLASALTIRARRTQEAGIAFQMPLYPMLSEAETPSSRNNTMPVWNTDANEAGWRVYRGQITGTPAEFSPSVLNDFKGLPPAFTFVGELDPFHDEVKEYFHHLYEADVPVMIKEYKGCFHGFEMLAPTASVSRKAQKLTKDAFRYAQKHYFCPQPEKADGEETEIDAVVHDIEQQHDLLENKDASVNRRDEKEVAALLDSFMDDFKENEASAEEKGEEAKASDETATAETPEEEETSEGTEEGSQGSGEEETLVETETDTSAEEASDAGEEPAVENAEETPVETEAEEVSGETEAPAHEEAEDVEWKNPLEDLGDLDEEDEKTEEIKEEVQETEEDLDEATAELKQIADETANEIPDELEGTRGWENLFDGLQEESEEPEKEEDATKVFIPPADVRAEAEKESKAIDSQLGDFMEQAESHENTVEEYTDDFPSFPEDPVFEEEKKPEPAPEPVKEEEAPVFPEEPEPEKKETAPVFPQEPVPEPDQKKGSPQIPLADKQEGSEDLEETQEIDMSRQTADRLQDFIEGDTSEELKNIDDLVNKLF